MNDRAHASPRTPPPSTPESPRRAPPARPRATRRPSHRRRAPSTVERLNAWYGEQHAIKDLTLSFAPNQATALIGPSGSGKSTVVRCINRMHEEIPGARASGRVLLDDVDVYGPGVDVVAVRRAIGMVFQKPNPFPTMSIFDNVAAGLRLTARKVGHDQVEAALRGAGLWEEVKDRLGKPGIGLSGGQQQRLCIARALAVEPDVLLMDEPASALDPISTLKIEELVQELKSRVTIAIVTHNMQQAARVADQTAFMLDGELVEVGPTEKIFTNPDDSRTEEYVTGQVRLTLAFAPPFQRLSSGAAVPTPRRMSEARAGAWVAGRPAAAFRWVGRLRGAELPNELTAMIVIALVATGGMLLVSFLPVSDRQPSGVLRVLAGCDALIAVALFTAGPRLPRAGLHAGIGAFVGVVTVLSANAHTLAGFISAARPFQWMAVYAALFLTAREARRHALGITSGACGAAPAASTARRAGGDRVHDGVGRDAAAERARRRLRAQADTDHLTGLLNRTGFAAAANREHALAGRTGAPLTVAVLDLDGFKHVNDAQGHAAGDRMLAELAACLARHAAAG